MKSFFLLFISFCALVLAGAEPLFVFDLEAPAVKSAVSRCPYARVEQDFEGTSVLTVTVPKGASEFFRTAGPAIPFHLNELKFAGRTILCEAEMKMENVSKPEYPYNGIKAMLMYRSGKRIFYPDLIQGVKRFGTAGWKRFRTNIEFHADASDGMFALGLQQSCGTVSFRNIRFFDAGNAPVSTLSQKNIPRAQYTFPRGKMMRGVMSPRKFREKDFADLRDWGANLIRWQLDGPKNVDFPV